MGANLEQSSRRGFCRIDHAGSEYMPTAKGVYGPPTAEVVKPADPP